jgi:hypothetical protein
MTEHSSTETEERVARALFQRDVEEDVCDGTWEENTAIHPRILADARAAIDAMAGYVVPAQRQPTPAAKWREAGHMDPHSTRYDCEREHLLMGSLTDDEMANAVFLNNSDIATLTAAKDRIRWLSRQLCEAQRLLREGDAAVPSTDRAAPLPRDHFIAQAIDEASEDRSNG